MLPTPGRSTGRLSPLMMDLAERQHRWPTTRRALPARAAPSPAMAPPTSVQRCGPCSSCSGDVGPARESDAALPRATAARPAQLRPAGRDTLLTTREVL